MTKMATVAAVIVNYRTPLLAMKALASLAPVRRHFPDFRVVIVDGGSGDGSAEILAEALSAPEWRDWVEFLPLPLNGGFGWANNQAILRLARSVSPPDYVLLFNPDAEMRDGGVEALAAVLDDHADIGAVGSLLEDEGGEASGAAFRFHSPAREFLRGVHVAALGRLLGISPMMVPSSTLADVDWVTGASVMFRMRALEQSGLFDSGFFLYFEEVELMWRLRRTGWRVAHEPASKAVHIGGASTGVDRDQHVVLVGPPRPAYWFASRRRMFARTRGRTGALMASLAWLSGHAMFMALRGLGLKRRVRINRGEAAGLIRHGLLATPDDLRPAYPSLGDPPGAEPAWMARRG